MAPTPYRGRIAPTPTGYLHLGHASTFLTAAERAFEGTLVFRMEDVDPQRCLPAYSEAAIDDLAWLGLRWQEGPDVGGTFGPYRQSKRREAHLSAWKRLRDGGFIYPCRRSRRDVAAATTAPHEEEPLFPVAWRTDPQTALAHTSPEGWNWRFRVPDHEVIAFVDARLGRLSRKALQDFGDFVIWNRDDIPAYELAVVVDDIAMGITEAVRGEDLLTSTARQILLYRALQATAPTFFHCPLLRSADGQRLAKREKSLSLRALRARGWSAEQVKAEVEGLRASAAQNEASRS